jgi:hypothetical protein
VTQDPVAPPPPPPPPATTGRTRVGLLVGLVLVLLAMCGGLAFTSWQVLGADDATATAAGDPSTRPTVAAPALSTPAPTAFPSAASPSAAPSDVPAGSAPQPIGISHVVTWPDHLQAVVYRVRRLSNVAVLVEVQIMNNTPSDITINQAQARLWYGDNREPADEFVDGSVGAGFDSTIRSGGKVYGEFAFAVPSQGPAKVEIELVPRPGDAPARFVGSVD